MCVSIVCFLDSKMEQTSCFTTPVCDPGQQGWRMPPSVSFWNWAGSNHAEVTVLHFFAGAHPYKLLYVNFDYFLSLKYTKTVSCAPVHFNIYQF